MSATSRYISVLLLLVAIALGSVITAQIVWIYNAYKLEEKNLRHNIQHTVEQTSDFIESNYGCFEVSNKIVLNNDEDIVIMHRQNIDNETVDLDTIRQYSAAFDEDSLMAINFTSPFPLTAEILIKYHYTPLDSGYEQASKNAHNVLNRINKQDKDSIFTGTFPITYFTGPDYFRTIIDSIIDVILDQKNINSSYYFLLEGANSDTALVKNFEEPRLFGYANASTATMYSNSYFFSPHKLYLWIPGERGAIIERMWAVLTGSFFVLVLLGWVTAAMAKTLLRQKKISEVKMDFINNMTHEFKTPVANIGLAVDSIENLGLIKGDFDINKYLHIIGSENYRMQENIEKILEISMLEKERIILKIENFNLAELLRTVISSFDMILENNGDKIALSINTENTMLAGDRVHLSNVFYNLIDNAIKYNYPNPEVSITVTVLEDFYGLKVLVADNGIGIPHVELERIFSRFYRVPTGNKHDVKGFGLGLSYVRTILEAHGGSVAVISTQGKGSVFTVVLPRAS